MAFLVFLAISPSILAYSGTALPVTHHLDEGDKQWGNTYSLKYGYDPYDMYIKGAARDFPEIYIYEFNLRVMFDADITNVGDENIFVMRFKYFGGVSMSIYVYYTDNTYTFYSESQQSTYLTKAYDIEDNKIVSYIKFYSLELWNPGRLYLDLVRVNY